MPTVEVPPPYQGPTGGIGRVEVAGGTARTCLDAVEARFPGFAAQVFDDDGKVHRFVRLFLNGEPLDPGLLDTPINEGDVIGILAAIAGG